MFVSMAGLKILVEQIAWDIQHLRGVFLPLENKEPVSQTMAGRRGEND